MTQKRYLLRQTGKPDRILEVLSGLDGIWIVGHIKPSGVHERYRAKALKPQVTFGDMQDMLDSYALKHGLLQVKSMLNDEYDCEAELLARDMAEILYRNNAYIALPWSETNEITRRVLIKSAHDLMHRYNIKPKKTT
ncbi:MAG: hypothetical protein ACRC2T_12190 [Thermoguttaceae bacterium]